ncbi:hypothetical protein CKM354_001292400 [Cercospora kikuchii]|uniref:Uncharacterized protein n=1 Tax=Cercospora kikuchii TaxID=84275 RepID=A0A9P3FMY7_9PEZI|nr:uncharacterized protein CKM354_001292400 [Cercospora kikuchii]GIZ49907.1 hypothetical protein CKM354_001292400 [Cercospora kikuchii]
MPPSPARSPSQNFGKNRQIAAHHDGRKQILPAYSSYATYSPIPQVYATSYTAEALGRLSFEHRRSASREYLASQRGRPLYAECRPLVSKRSASRELAKPGGRQSPRLEASPKQLQYATAWTAARCRAQAQRRALPKRVSSYELDHPSTFTRYKPHSLNTCSAVADEWDADELPEMMSENDIEHACFAQRSSPTIDEVSGIGDGFVAQCSLPTLGELLQDVVETGKDVQTTSEMAENLAVATASHNMREWSATPEPDHVPLPMARSAKVLRDCIATGSLKGTRVEALADSCADNFISDAYLQMQGLPYKTGKRRDIRVGNGRTAFSTLGTIRLPWKFQNEAHVEYHIDFDVIPARFCSYAITLGGTFSLATRTLAERFEDRIFRKPRRSVLPRLFYSGASHVRVKGYCEGIRVAALADTCSDLDLLSPEMLAELGYEQHDILTDDEHCVFVELPGGLIVRTSGMVRDVEFRLGNGCADDSYIRDFYILPGLPAGVLIGEDFLWESDAFSKYCDDFIELDDEDFAEDIQEGMFLNIKLVQQARSIFARFNKRAFDKPDSEAHIKWQAQCKDILDKIDAVHNQHMEEEQKRDAILRLEQTFRQVRQKKPTAPTRVNRSHRPP